MDPLTIITTGWSIFKLGYEVTKFIDSEFSEKGLQWFRIFATNESNEKIYIALKYYQSKEWKIKKWMALQTGETALLLGDETQLKYRPLYCHAFNQNSTLEWRGNDFIDFIDGKDRGFYAFDPGEDFCNFKLVFSKPR
jgi:hypothetical protein